MLPDNNTTVLCAEVTCDSNDELSSTDENTIFGRVADQLEECRLVRKTDIIEHFDKRLRDVYPIYDLEYKKNKRLVFDYLDSINNFFSIGRSGGFDYTGMLDCLDIGIKTADFISHNRKDRLVLRNYFTGYVVVD
jgi:protoporphyrinogen oxidase